MTPHEKAKEILSRLFPYTEGWVNRKAVAVIVIDKVKEALREACSEEMLAIHMIYWEKVKQEIDAL